MRTVKLMCAGLYNQYYGKRIDQLFERVHRLVPIRLRTPFGTNNYSIIKGELSIEGNFMDLFRPGQMTGKIAGIRGEENIFKYILSRHEVELHDFLEYFTELCALTNEFLDRANKELDRLEAQKS